MLPTLVLCVASVGTGQPKRASANLVCATGKYHHKLQAIAIACPKKEKFFLERLQEKMLTIGLEPITLWEQILSLSCLPVSPSEH